MSAVGRALDGGVGPKIDGGDGDGELKGATEIPHIGYLDLVEDHQTQQQELWHRWTGEIFACDGLRVGT